MNAADAAPAVPFEDSRRLTGANQYFAGPGAVLDAPATVAFDAQAETRWRAQVAQLREALQWPDGASIVRRHAGGVSLAIAAPIDQLFTATEVNEYALYQALGRRAGAQSVDGEGQPPRPHPAHFDAGEALRRLQAAARAEANPGLLALLHAAAMHAIPARLDDEALSLGEGEASRLWPLPALPDPASVPWAQLHAIPKALVTGSNGKTTTVRLLAALLAATGRRVGYSCTDGVVVDGTRLAAGDYSGPAGARTVLRAAQAQAAVLETARGGLLRRGLAVDGAGAAIVTNVSEDHFGEYGIDSLADLAEVKLVVAKALGAHGVLVLNAADPTLVTQAPRTAGVRIGWFAHDLDVASAQGTLACGVQDGQLLLREDGETRDLGAIADMPLSLGGAARYNIENIAAAVLAAHALGVPAEVMAAELLRFGAEPLDNPGRLQRWRLGDVEVVLDYAHNPEGLRGLLDLATQWRGRRLGILLGHAGNRRDADYRAVAEVVAKAHPDRVWLKDIGGNYLRGRASGEVAGILRDSLHAHGLPLEALPVCLDETAAAREALAWAQPGDLLLLPVHEPSKREAVLALLNRLQAERWHSGQVLPDLPAQPTLPKDR
ncbi:Mur ligase family protein [Thermomonas sp.]|uniref:Mur ligase family protein n=1 Tax=Thermomonas sp. TaxID=1971895 RepID=UPI002BFB59DB|nr:Mur ligase family protein [Thermomonas sp.]HRO64064.1 Mur ligase family protein [Thermomonas sp.]